MFGRGGFLSNMPDVTKNLLIINGLMFLVLITGENFGHQLNRILGLYYPGSQAFSPYQFATHFFMHGNFMHLFFNMYALFLFGSVLERYWGPKRFLIFYIITALGASLLQIGVQHFRIMSLASEVQPEMIQAIKTEGLELLRGYQNYTDETLGALNILYNIPMVGASGAVFGLLLGFGMLFPNTELMLIFIPIPIKAKYFVMFYGALELFLGVANLQGDNIAHFAHIGGMLFGFFLIKYWQKGRNDFY